MDASHQMQMKQEKKQIPIDKKETKQVGKNERQKQSDEKDNQKQSDTGDTNANKVITLREIISRLQVR